MTPNNQVSPVIRISQGERDASARATHLEAATRKFLVTTNERKQMSTKTNFKRIALVAVASLGLGVLSSVPSQAAVDQTVVSAVTAGTATTTVADSLTAATFTITSFVNVNDDQLRITLIPKTANANAQGAYLTVVETLAANTLVDTRLVSGTSGAAARAATKVLVDYNPQATTRTTLDTVGVTSAGVPTGNFVVRADTSVSAQATISAKFRMQLDSQVNIAQLTPGTYTYTAVVRAYDASQTTETAAKTQYVDLTITVPVLATASKVVNGALSSVTLADLAANAGTSGTVVDSTIAVANTASTTDAAVVRVRLRNASAGNAQESVTATISAGRIGVTGSMGRSVVLPYDAAAVTAGKLDLSVQPDGTAGTATITISTPSYTFPSKTVTFYADTTDKITAAAYASVIGSSGIGVHGSQFDAAGNSWGAGTALYAYSSDTTTISSYGSACTWNSTLKVALCNLTGVKNGTANITLRDAATVAASTKASSAVAVKVNINAAATVALEFNKTSYAPGEKATLKIIVKDAAGAVLPAQTFSNLFSTGGLTTSSSIGSAVSSTVLSNVSVVTMATVAASTDTPLVTLDPIGQVTFYMPLAGGAVTVTGKGGASLPAAGQVTVTATATVTDSGAAALAAVTALATTVASLKTLITTLTNLVLKIQKKVKA
jgi:trimeric autotransporter adhesin